MANTFLESVGDVRAARGRRAGGRAASKTRALVARMRLRELTQADPPAVHELLRACRLPVEGVPEDAAWLLVAESDAQIVGAAGLELHAGDGLLRSVAVAAELRGSSAVLMFREL